MANKTKSDYDKMTNDELVVYLDKLPLNTFKGYVDPDTKVRYFLYKYGKQFAEALKGTDLFFAGVLGQSMYESTYGKSGLTLNANNFAGVKYVADKHSDFYEDWTTEYVNGKKVRVKAKFAKFPNALDGINVLVKGTLMSPRYLKARQQKTPEDFVYELAKAGFATANATTYKNDIKYIIRRVQNKIPIGKVV
jgi:flagellum-specific peptidoglycan hydrolase FlgJ